MIATMPSNSNALKASALSCVKQHKLLFANIDFELQAGELMFIQGINGSGKSSLLRIIAGLATPTTGHLLWQQTVIADNKANYQQALHYISHDNGLKLGLTVAENITLMQTLYENTQIDPKQVLATLQLTAQQNTISKNLSAGQKRKLALAKLLLIQKPIWILDEPLTALDSHTQQLFLNLLRAHLENKGICILTSHQPLTTTFTNMQTLELTAC